MHLLVAEAVVDLLYARQHLAAVGTARVKEHDEGDGTAERRGVELRPVGEYHTEVGQRLAHLDVELSPVGRSSSVMQETASKATRQLKRRRRNLPAVCSKNVS